MTTTNKQQEKSPFQVMWLILKKEHIYRDSALCPRALNFSKKVEKELQKKGFVKINKHWCKHEADAYSLAADKLSAHALIAANEPIGKRQRSLLFYITDHQFGKCPNSDYSSMRTSKQRESTIVL